MYLAGLRIPDDDVRELAELVDEPTRSFLEKSLALETRVVALTIEDRERILWALDDARTDSLAELRGVLLSEHEWRPRRTRVDQTGVGVVLRGSKSAPQGKGLYTRGSRQGG